ncbi:MAG: phospholipid carrier-dependent glycosyltransferase [Caulobacteraceae bacterium]|nr:phospholipid carrier-dependent glycosyltransferase [Caulobacter sp.]
MNELKLALAPASPAAVPAAGRTAGGAPRLLAAVRSPLVWTALLVAVAGACLRVWPWAGWVGKIGVDEAYYSRYLTQLVQSGLGGYPDIVDNYKLLQANLVGSILPPTRFLYIFCAYLWHGAFGGESLECFRAVSRLFGVLTLLLAGLFARRLLADRRLALGAFALMAASPLQIHMAQHALADGFFEFWALGTLWALWECLNQPGHKGWLAAYGLGLAALVTTKENAFFVWVAVVALLVLNRWVRFGQVNRALVVLTFVGPLVGVAVLVNLSGGLTSLIDVYRLGVPKNLALPYAIKTGDGPWYRYLLDLLTMSPLVLLLAVGTAWQLRVAPDGRRDDRPLIFALGFIAASYVLMCNVKYGMNLRYATMWDLPLRVLAVTQVGWLAARWPAERRAWVLTLAVAGLCLFDVNQYYELGVQYPLYELAPTNLLHALSILK